MRAQWNSRMGFILAAAGSAVGLGNIWRFPNMVAENGGGVFLLIYLLVAFSVGFSILVAETALGRLSQSNVYAAYTKHSSGIGKLWGIFGILALIVVFIISTYYFVVAGWSLNFSSQYLLDIVSDKEKFIPSFDDAIGGKLVGDTASVSRWTTPLIWGAAFLAFCFVILVSGVNKGLELANKILMPLLILIIVFMAVYVLFFLNTGIGSQWDGVSYYLKPDLSKLSFDVIVAAVGQAFFSLSIGYAIILTYGSYLSREESIPQAARAIVIADTAIAFLAGLITLPIVFAFGMEQYSCQIPEAAELAKMTKAACLDAGGSILANSTSVSSNAGLAFLTLPKVFANMPSVMGALFFFLITIAALTSYVSIVEPIISWLTETFNISRLIATIATFIAVFVVGIYVSLGMGGFKALGLDSAYFNFHPLWVPGSPEQSVLDTFDTLVNNLLIPLGALGLTLFVSWAVWPKVSDEIQTGATFSAQILKLFRLFLGVICPILLIAVILKAIGLMDYLLG